MSVDLRATLLERYRSVRAATEALASPLSPEDQVLQSMPSASPTKWHRAHTTWFFETFVLVPRGAPTVREEYGFIFNSYYEAVGPRHARPKRGILSRPSCEEIAGYRRTVDGRMIELLSSADEASLAALEPLVALGLAHEEQHQELLLTDILHAFSESPLRPAYRATSGSPLGRPDKGVSRDIDAPRFIEHEGGVVGIGHEGMGFAFDNEGPRHRVFLEPFALASRPVVIAELRAFIEAGGYRTPSLWLAEGFDRVRALGLVAPHNVECEPGSLRTFTTAGTIEPEPGAPASHLDYYEADAIARFLGGRLPTEAEWETFARRANPERGNFRESGALRPRASEDKDAGQIEQLYGDVWEWTSSAHGPYPGFSAAPGAVGEYNGKFMVSQLVLRGGSCFTPKGHVRPSYRNFWPPDTAFQMTGARVARDVGASR
jgi:ergothioneine biosynthesis protein EgtB